MKGNKKMVKGMDGVGKRSRMAQFMMAIGRMMFLMAEEYLFKRTEANMKANLKMKKVMGWGSIFRGTRKPYMMDSSKTICKMDLEHKLESDNINIRAISKIE